MKNRAVTKEYLNKQKNIITITLDAH